jgi:hypothetical protein
MCATVNNMFFYPNNDHPLFFLWTPMISRSPWEEVSMALAWIPVFKDSMGRMTKRKACKYEPTYSWVASLEFGSSCSSTSVLWFGPEYVHDNACISMRARHTYYLPIQRKSKRSRKCPKSHSERNTYIHVLQPCLHHWKVVHCNNY